MSKCKPILKHPHAVPLDPDDLRLNQTLDDEIYHYFTDRGKPLFSKEDMIHHEKVSPFLDAKLVARYIELFYP